MKKLINYAAIIGLFLLSGCTACNRVQPNFEGVFMDNYGRNGKTDFKKVTGSQGILWWGQSLYQVPMFEQRSDFDPIGVTAKDGGYFTIDPTYTYKALPDSGINIVFNYKHVGFEADTLGTTQMDHLEAQILDPMVINAYKEEARAYSTDSLMNNLNVFEKKVEDRLEREFKRKFFTINSLTSGLRPPESMTKAIEARNNAVQQANQVRNELEVSRMSLEKAKIDAEANRIRTAGLSSMNLTEKWIEALRNTDNKVIITDGKTPIILGGQ